MPKINNDGASRGSAVGMTGYGLHARKVGVRVQEFSILHVVQTDSGANQVSYTLGTGGSFTGSKTAGA
jgi:hypothetical protein